MPQAEIGPRDAPQRLRKIARKQKRVTRRKFQVTASIGRQYLDLSSIVGDTFRYSSASYLGCFLMDAQMVFG